MRINKNVFLVSALLCFLSIVGVVVLCVLKSKQVDIDVWLNISIGLFTGFFVSVCVSIIQYNYEKGRYIYHLITSATKTLVHTQACALCMEKIFKNVPNPNIVYESSLFDKIRFLAEIDYDYFIKPYDYTPLISFKKTENTDGLQLLLELKQEQDKIDAIRSIASIITKSSFRLNDIDEEIESGKAVEGSPAYDRLCIEHDSTLGAINANIGALHSLCAETVVSLDNMISKVIKRIAKKSVWHEWHELRADILVNAKELYNRVFRMYKQEYRK